MKIKKEQFLIDTLKHCGVPYIWGGESEFTGADCSGFTEIVLKKYGLDPEGRQTAQRYFDYFSKPANGTEVKRSEVGLGTLIFYGKSKSQITHIAIGLNNDQMVESGGGGSKTTTIKAALEANAKVRVAAINRRMDQVAFVKIKGLELI